MGSCCNLHGAQVGLVKTSTVERPVAPVFEPGAPHDGAALQQAPISQHPRATITIARTIRSNMIFPSTFDYPP